MWTVTAREPQTLFVELGASPLQNLVPLVIGGLIAAPFGGWVVKYVQARTLMIGVGVLILCLSSWQIFTSVRSLL